MLVAAMCCICWGVIAAAAAGELAFDCDFNDAELSWRLLNRKSAARILAHERLPGGARDNRGMERLIVAAPAGESVMLWVPIPRVAVLPELLARLWVKANRPAVQLGLRLVLPRTQVEKSQSPQSVIVRGEAYSRPGQWQQLVLGDVPKRLAAEARMMRAREGAAVDTKEAYVDAVVLILPGEPGGVECLTDKLEVDGVKLPATDENRLASHDGQAISPHAAATAPARLQGNILLLDERPFLVRIIEWRGEPLAFLAERGFNVVQLAQPPDEEQILEAERLGLWFLGVPPRPDAIVRGGIGRSGDRVLAWLLEDDAIELDANFTARWAELIREHDRPAARPVILAPRADWSNATQSADILIARHAKAHRYSAADYEAWLSTRQRSSRLGTPLWAGFDTQFDANVQQQSLALTGGHDPPPSMDLAQLDALLQTSCFLGVRGFVFRSQSSLAEPDAATRHRAALLELLNRRLQLLEPWLAGGSITGRIRSSDDRWSGVLWQVDRARLLVPVSEATSAESYTASPPSTNFVKEVSFLVPGVPESSQLFAISPVAVRALPAHRVAGGTRLALPATGQAMALITEDSQIIRSFRERAARVGPAVVRLQRDLASQRATLVADNARRLSQLGYAHENAARSAGAVAAQLSQIDMLVASGRVEQAFELAIWANRVLDQAANDQRRSIPQATAYESDPLAVSYDQILANGQLRRTIASLRGGENLLYGGDFEDLGQLTHFGWQNYQHPTPGVESHVALSSNAPKVGGYCLELRATARSAADAAQLAEQPPAWISSPPVVVNQGQIVEITGWIRVDAGTAETENVLEIFDSLGGPQLSLSMGPTSGWQPFRLIRAAAEPAELRVTFALVGLGTARLDAVMIRTLAQPVARRLPPAQVILSR